MPIKRKNLEDAAKAGFLNENQIEPLLNYLNNLSDTKKKSKFGAINFLYYLGGFIAISAVTLFTGLIFQSMGMPALFVCSCLYFLFAIFTAHFFKARHYFIPSGIFATISIALVPLALFSLQHVLGNWNEHIQFIPFKNHSSLINSQWLLIEVMTLLSGLFIFIRFPYPIIMLPLAITVLFMLLDIIPSLLFHFPNKSKFLIGPNLEFQKIIFLWYGVFLIVIAFIIDLITRHKKDFAFWLYLFGVFSFWITTTSIVIEHFTHKLSYLILNFVLVFFGIILGRRVFLFFGVIGIIVALGILSSNLFSNSFYFVIMLTVLGFILILIGLLWSKYEKNITARIQKKLPKILQELLEARKN